MASYPEKAPLANNNSSGMPKKTTTMYTASEHPVLTAEFTEPSGEGQRDGGAWAAERR